LKISSLPPPPRISAKIVLISNIILNLGILALFKYYNFFAANFVSAFASAGIYLQAATLKIILPVGVSFYTFQALSYSIDVYRKKIEPTKDLVSFFTYVAFFPQLVAGPIERATNLLPQFYVKRTFDYAKAMDGLRQILWGLFKKVVIADNCAAIVNPIFDDYQSCDGTTLLIGAIFFTFQIYGDFSGYSDIAIGTARLFGFNLLRNFAFPYFSRDIAEFWRRWHISLTTWFRDYLYIPLGGSRGTKWQVVRNTFIIFLVSGFWHGANWTFIVWGAYHAALFLPLILLGKNRKYTNVVAEGKAFPAVKEFFQMGLTFSLVAFGWIFFRAESIGDAFAYIERIGQLETIHSFYQIFNYKRNYFFLLIMLIIEWCGRENQFALEKWGLTWKRGIRYACYFIIAFTIICSNCREEAQEFIYFQF
jgi:D-alanyl-lipoteichoic acid acyltransferase DltB (MBOAT superfamily)